MPSSSQSKICTCLLRCLAQGCLLVEQQRPWTGRPWERPLERLHCCLMACLLYPVKEQRVMLCHLKMLDFFLGL